MTHLFDLTLESGRLDGGGDAADYWYVDGGTLELVPGAVIGGSPGWELTPVNGRKGILAKEVNSLSRLRQGWLFTPGDIAIPDTKLIYLARNYHLDATDRVYALLLRYNAPNLQIQIVSYHDDGATNNGVLYTLTTTIHTIEIDWKAASAAGANDGFLKLYVDGTLRDSIINQDNDTLRVKYPCLGTGTPPTDAISGKMGFALWSANDDGTELTPPLIASAAIANAVPDRIVLTYTEDVVSENFTLGLSAKVNGSAANINSAVLQADDNTLWITLSAEVISTDTVTLSYSKAAGDVVDVVGNIMPTYVDYAVTNNVLPPAPPEVSAIATTSQTVVSVVFNETVHAADFTAGVSMTVNGGAATISSGVLQGDGLTVLYTTTTVMKPRDTILWSYDTASGEILDEDGGELEAVTNHAVTNNTRQQYLAWIDFEDGGTPWGATSITNPDDDIAVGAGGALNGTANGATLTLDDNTDFYFLLNWADSTTGYLRARFYYDPNTLSMAASNAHNLLQIYNGSSQVLGIVTTNYISGQYRINISAYNDAGSAQSSSAYIITDAPHYIEIQIDRAATTGQAKLYIDGALKETVANIDNDVRFAAAGYALFGCLGVDTGSRGTELVDELVIIDRNETIGA